MNTQSSKYKYSMEDSINGLTITYQGRKSWWHVGILFVFGIFIALLLIYLIAELAPFFIMEQADPFLMLILLLGIVVFGFAIHQLFVSAVDALLDVEKVSINDRCIQIEKSGFKSIEKSKVITTDGKMCFFTLRGLERSISFHRSRFISQLYNIGMLEAHNIHPMRCILRGISKQDSIAVLEGIKTKYPQYDIYYRKLITGKH